MNKLIKIFSKIKLAIKFVYIELFYLIKKHIDYY